MLQIVIKPTEKFDEERERFIYTKGQTLLLEHSLVSISKWESKWHKPFLTDTPMTPEETLDYIKCMTLTQNVSDDTYLCITNEDIAAVNEYIKNPMTATWFSNEKTKKGPGTKEIVTSEIIYYWMITLNIPVEFQKWHLNRLLTLIKVCNLKNTPQKKMSRRELMSRNKSLNEARRAALGTKG